MARLFSYKDLKDVKITEIYNKYSDRSITIMQFKNRAYKGLMPIGDALSKPVNKYTPLDEEQKQFLDNLYNKTKKTVKDSISKSRFIIKLSQGFAPDKAIININPKVIKSLNNAECIKKLREKEKVEKLAVEKKARPFNKEEKEYLTNIDIVNSGFSKIRTRKRA